MVGKIDLIDEQNHHSYVLKVYTNGDQPTFLFHCSYLNKSKPQVLEKAKNFAQDMSKKLNLPLEESISA